MIVIYSEMFTSIFSRQYSCFYKMLQQWRYDLQNAKMAWKVVV